MKRTGAKTTVTFLTKVSFQTRLQMKQIQSFLRLQREKRQQRSKGGFRPVSRRDPLTTHVIRACAEMQPRLWSWVGGGCRGSDLPTGKQVAAQLAQAGYLPPPVPWRPQRPDSPGKQARVGPPHAAWGGAGRTQGGRITSRPVQGAVSVLGARLPHVEVREPAYRREAMTPG